MLFILVQSRGNSFAIDAMKIHTVLPYCGLSRRDGTSFAGVVDYAGGKVAAVDLVQIWSGKASRNLFSTRCILAKVRAGIPGGVLGIVSEGITSCAEIDESKIENFPWSAGEFKLSKAFEYASEMYKIIEPDELYALCAREIAALGLPPEGDGSK